MTKIRHVDRSETNDRELFTLGLADFTSRPESISFPRRHFVVLLAADSSQVDTETLGKFARWLLDAGCVYFCAWGPGCQRMHDIFDEECFEVDPVIMTTWHDGETLDDALWFFLNTAFPDEGYEKMSGTSLAISVGNPEWDEYIGKQLANVQEFNQRVLNMNKCHGNHPS